jgi:hypothetical protein
MPDEVLGHQIAAGTGGHDDWGFRNYEVPQKADIVAIGDSQTYGISATFTESWPAHLAGLQNTTVYNMSLGGYGPLQYLHLLKTKAFSMNPRTIVVGLYFGNDFADAHNLAYSNPNWATYRNDKLIAEKSENNGITIAKKDSRFLGGVRDWFAKRSVLYRIVSQSVLGDSMREIEFKKTNTQAITLEFSNFRQFFTPGKRLSALDKNLQKVREGVRISKTALQQIHSICLENNTNLLVVLIPTKELVYSQIIKEKHPLELTTDYSNLIENETAIRSDFMQFFETESIRFTDALPVLMEAASNGEHIYPTNDGHPNGNGYLIIAQLVKDRL